MRHHGAGRVLERVNLAMAALLVLSLVPLVADLAG